jgi:hypothetical protein
MKTYRKWPGRGCEPLVSCSRGKRPLFGVPTITAIFIITIITDDCIQASGLDRRMRSRLQRGLRSPSSASGLPPSLKNAECMKPRPS